MHVIINVILLLTLQTLTEYFCFLTTKDDNESAMAGSINECKFQSKKNVLNKIKCDP